MVGRQRILGLCLAATLTVSCVPKPKQAYTVEQIPQIDNLEELMRVQAHSIDGWMAKREQASFADAEYLAMNREARVLRAAAASLRGRFAKERPKGFAYHAWRLDAGAEQLEAATQSKSAAATRSSLYAIRRACRSCHSEYK